MNNDRTIGLFIAELRKEKGLTQTQLAKKIHVTDKAISRWENNNTIPDIDTLRALCKVFDVTLDELYNCARINKKAEKRKRRIKLTMLFTAIIIFLVSFLFLLLYFICNFNSVKFYILSLSTDNFDIAGSYFIETNEGITFKLGNITFYDDVNIDNVYMELYEKDGNDNNMLYSGLYTNVYFENILDIDPNNLYLHLIYDYEDNSIDDEYQLASTLKYQNNKIFYRKGTKKIKTDNFLETNDDIKSELLKLGYEEKSEDIFSKEDNAKRSKADINTVTYFNLMYKNFDRYSESKNNKEIITYYSSKNVLTYQFIDLKKKKEVVTEEFVYNILDEKFTCAIGRCNDVENIIDSLSDEIKIIKMMDK